jgi:hypothetical protein
VTQPCRGRTFIVAGAVAAAAAGSAFAAPASHVVDKTYSCRSFPHQVFFVGAQVRLPPGGQVQAGPAMATVTTAADHAFQMVFKDVKKSLKVDKAICRPSSRRVALRPGRLPLNQTVTPDFMGHITGKCPTHTKRVLIHFRVSLAGGVPQRALFAVRKDTAKGRSLAFFKWAPRKISGYLAKSCTTY